MNDLVVITCPPYPEYATPLKDQSHSELFDCPKCKNKMWLSDKKKGALLFASSLGQEILLACYICFAKLVKDDPAFFTDSERINL